MTNQGENFQTFVTKYCGIIRFFLFNIAVRLFLLLLSSLQRLSLSLLGSFTVLYFILGILQQLILDSSLNLNQSLVIYHVKRITCIRGWGRLARLPNSDSHCRTLMLISPAYGLSWASTADSDLATSTSGLLRLDNKISPPLNAPQL